LKLLSQIQSCLKQQKILGYFLGKAAFALCP